MYNVNMGAHGKTPFAVLSSNILSLHALEQACLPSVSLECRDFPAAGMSGSYWSVSVVLWILEWVYW